jgi:hypothetical protein
MFEAARCVEVASAVSMGYQYSEQAERKEGIDLLGRTALSAAID